YVSAPDVPACSFLRIIALSVANAVEQASFESLRVAGKLDGKRFVLQNLYRFDSCEIVEEPRARSEHLERTFLHLEQLGSALDSSFIVASADRAGDELERFGDGRADDVAVRVTHSPRIGCEKTLTVALENVVQLIRQPFETFTHRGSPHLARMLLRCECACAVGAPSLNPVRTAPRAGSYENSRFLCRIARKKRCKVLDRYVTP